MTSDMYVWFLRIFVFISMGRISAGYTRPNGVCIDSLYAIQGHTMCIVNSRLHPIHDAERKEIIRAHDSVRGAVIPKAYDLLTIAYATPLEKEAQIWAEQCSLDHDEVHLRAMAGRYMVGQNILLSSSNITWQQVVDEWAKEKVNFQYGQTNDINLVGNYTQMISAETVAVGCGMAPCGGVYFYVCNYAPSDIASRVNRPYTEETSGQGVDECRNRTATNLCDCSGRLCLNGGKVNLATCLCDCPPDSTGKRYEPDFCELMCEPPTDPDSCLSKNEASCKTDADTFINCPWMCNVCPYAGVNYTEGQATMPWTTTVPTTSTATFNGASTASGQTQTPSSISALVTQTPTSTRTTSKHISSSSSIASTKRSVTTQAPSGSGLRHNQKGDNGGTCRCLTCFTLIGALMVSLTGLA